MSEREATLLWLPPRSRDITGGCGGWCLEETSSEYPCECVCVCVCVCVHVNYTSISQAMPAHGGFEVEGTTVLVNLYENCTQDTSTCGISMLSGTVNVETCLTAALPREVEVSKHCTYHTLQYFGS